MGEPFLDVAQRVEAPLSVTTRMALEPISTILSALAKWSATSTALLCAEATALSIESSNLRHWSFNGNSDPIGVVLRSPFEPGRRSGVAERSACHLRWNRRQ